MSGAGNALTLLILIELLVPLAMLLALALLRAPAWPDFLLHAAAMSCGLLLCWILFPWEISSYYLRQLLPLLTVAALLIGARRIGHGKPPALWQRIAVMSSNGVLLLVFGLLCVLAMAGQPPRDSALRLASPLRDGSYLVGQGGASPLLNAHATVAPQNHALDIVGLTPLGRRSGTGGEGLARYAIFGATLYSPCEGRVLVTVDGLPDQVIGRRDRKNLAGNYVLLDCDGTEVLLAHLRQGSVAVASGQNVTQQTVLGAVGNSGNSSEPHLHLHAERGGERGVILNGEAVPMLIDGRYLVRGDRL